MKRVYSRWSAIALILIASVVEACSAADGGENSNGVPSGQDASTSSVGDPTSRAPSQEASGESGQREPVPAKQADASSAPNDEAPTQSLSVLSGAVTNLGTGTLANGLGGVGTIAAASGVQIWKLVDGALELVGQGSIDALGNYDIEVPLGLDTLIAQVVDATGHVLGSAIVGNSGVSPARNVIVAPITSETSLEATVLLGAMATPITSALGDALSLTLDVSALVDPQLTDAVNSAIAAGADPAALVNALSAAVVSFARARTGSLVAAGISIDADAAIQAELAALQHLAAGLSGALTDPTTVSQVTATLLNDLGTVLSTASQAGATANVRAQVAGSLAFAATLSTALSDVPGSDAIVFAATRALSGIESTVIAGAVKTILENAGASPSLVDAAVAAGNKLIADVAAATNIAALQQARLDFLSAVVGGLNGNSPSTALLGILPVSNVSGGLLGDLLAQTTEKVDAVLDPVLERVTDLTQALESKLAQSLSGLSQGGASPELDRTLAVLIDALAKFGADVEALGPSLASGNAGQVPTAAVTDLLSTVQVLLRGLLPQ
jgi:hypothetical protein